MEFNRLISLVIGFIVLILVFVWVGSRFRSATKSEASNKATITATVTPTKGESKGWNPLAFLFNRNTTPTVTPSKAVAKKVSITPTGSEEQGTTIVVNGTNQESQQMQNVDQDSNTVIVYKNNRTGEVKNTNGSVTKGGITKIPETGAPTMLIPIAFSALTLGAYLKKRV